MEDASERRDILEELAKQTLDPKSNSVSRDALVEALFRVVKTERSRVRAIESLLLEIRLLSSCRSPSR